MAAAIGIVVGVDMAKTGHYAQAVGIDGTELFVRGVLNDQQAIQYLLDEMQHRMGELRLRSI